MFCAPRSFISRRALLTGLLSVGVAFAASASQSEVANGLGSSWPNTTDVSTSPHWHVYVFTRDGIRYIQINDLNGTVRTAFAAANGEVLVLPMGADSQHVSVTKGVSTSSTSAATETVYSGNGVNVTIAPPSSKLAAAATAMTCDSAYACSGGQIAIQVVSP